MWYSSPRPTQTTIPCKACTHPLIARRTCHDAYLHCEKCKKDSPVQIYVAQMDDALENFLGSLFSDRV